MTMTAQITLPTEFNEALNSQITATVDAAVAAALKKSAEPKYLQLGEAARFAGIARNTLTAWTRDKGLPICIIDGVQRISRSDLEIFMTSHTHRITK